MTFSSGFRCDSVRDVEGSRAADANGGAPLWHGATWTARMRSAVSETRCQTETSDPIMAARPHSAAEFGRAREQSLVVVPQRTVLGSGAASGLIQTVRARSKLERRAQCCDVRSAAGARALWVPCQCALCKVVAPAIILKHLESGRWRRGGQFDSGAAFAVTVTRQHTRMRHAAGP